MPGLEITDFSGGITDDYIDGLPSSAEKMDNLLIDSNKKPVQRPAFDIYNSSAPQIPPGNQAIDSLYYFDKTVFAKSGTKLYYLQDTDSSWTTLAGPNADAFADSELGAKCSWSEWKGHLIITPGPSTNKKGGCRTVKVYRNGSNVWTLVQAGLPRAQDGTQGGVFSGPTVTVGDPGFEYIWYTVFARSYTAKVNGVNVTFKDRGSPIIHEETCDEFDSNSITLGSLDYTNATGENYDTANMIVEVYRTEANGSVPFLAIFVALGADLNDSTDDDDLGGELYPGASDGINNDPPPKCYFSDIVEGFGWYLACIDLDDGSFQINRAIQSQTADPDSAPAGNYVDIEGDVPTALSHAGTNPIVFFRNRTYRLEGRYDSSGGGFIRAVLISATEGSVSQQVSRTTDGIYFSSENGYCYTNGYQVLNLSKHLRRTYKALANKANISAAYSAREKRAYFGIESSALVPSVTGKNNALMVLDENWISGDRGAFTTASAGTSLQPVSLHYDSKNDRLLIGDARGYVFKFDSAKTSDPAVDTSASYSDWARQAIIYDYVSCAFAFGTGTLTKWVTKAFLVLKNLTGSLSLDLFSHNDDQPTPKAMKVVRERTTTATGLHKVKRFFPKGGLRCVYKQLQIKKGLVDIAVSDDYALATTNTVAKTVLLASGTWPDDGDDSLVGHSIYFAADSYVAGYVITIQSGDTLTLATTPPAVTGGKWEVKGYPKAETLELHSLAVEYEVIGESYTAYGKADSGDNA